MAKKRTIESLRAIDRAYGRQLTGSRQLMLSLEPGVILGLLATLMWMRPVMTIIMFIVGLAYGYFSLMPRQVKAQYENDSLYERHKALSTLTGALSASANMPPHTVLTRVAGTTTGELHDDFVLLTAKVVQFESRSAVHKAFSLIEEKYRADSYFVQYMEQLEAFALDSTLDMETIEMLNDMHNTMYEKSLQFQRVRQGALQETHIMMGVVFGLGVFMEFIAVKLATSKYFFRYFWHGMAGWITGALMIFAISFIMIRFYKRYFDTSVTQY